MSTIYILQPDDDERKGAIDDLLDSLDVLYPDELITRQALAITTDVPEVLQLLSHFAPPNIEPAAPPRKRYKSRPKPGRDGKNGAGGPEPAHVERQISELEAEPDPARNSPDEYAGEKKSSGPILQVEDPFHRQGMQFRIHPDALPQGPAWRSHHAQDPRPARSGRGRRWLALPAPGCILAG